MTRRSLRTSVLALATLLPVLLVSVATSQQSDECIECDASSAFDKDILLRSSLPIPKNLSEDSSTSINIITREKKNMQIISHCFNCVRGNDVCELDNRVDSRAQLQLPLTVALDAGPDSLDQVVTTTIQSNIVMRKTKAFDGQAPRFTYAPSANPSLLLAPFQRSLFVSLGPFGFSIAGSRILPSVNERCVCKPEAGMDPCAGNEPPEIQAPSQISVDAVDPTASERVTVTIPTLENDITTTSITVSIDGTPTDRSVSRVSDGIETFVFVTFDVPAGSREVQIFVSDECGMTDRATIPVITNRP